MRRYKVKKDVSLLAKVDRSFGSSKNLQLINYVRQATEYNGSDSRPLPLAAHSAEDKASASSRCNCGNAIISSSVCSLDGWRCREVEGC